MASKIRKSPPVCLFVSLYGLISGRIRLSSEHLGCRIEDENGKVFEVFREIRLRQGCGGQGGAGKSPFEGGFRGMSLQGAALNELVAAKEGKTFAVTFKFARLTHQQNKIASVIPMLLITGFPGFIRKVYGVDAMEGFWMGLYQWRSPQDLEAYKKSFVFRMMNKRAEKNSLKSYE